MNEYILKHCAGDIFLRNYLQNDAMQWQRIDVVKKNKSIFIMLSEEGSKLMLTVFEPCRHETPLFPEMPFAQF